MSMHEETRSNSWRATQTMQHWLLPGCIMLVVFGIKHWYSGASVHELQWILRPLVFLLEQVLPGYFVQQVDGTWLNTEWQILLVKSCSGLNFFMMSLMGQALIFAQRHETSNLPVIQRLFLQITCALGMAWSLTLLANTLRILLAMFCIRHPDLLGWIGLNAESQHRLAGLLVYFPVLVVQMAHMQNRISTAYWQATAIVLCMLVVVPLLTGNALADSDQFFRHCLWLLLVIGSGGALLKFSRHKQH